MSTSRNSSLGQANRRAQRFTAVADAWRCTPPDQSPPGLGSLDVPLSVWAESGSGSLVTGLVRELTKPNTFGDVAVCGLVDGWRAATLLRRVVVYGDHRITTEARRLAGHLLAGVHFVTAENLANQLAAKDGTLTLIIAAYVTSRGEGFWGAAHCALQPGGYLAVVTGSSNPNTHAAIVGRACSAGFAYRHHVIATTPTALSQAVDAETVTTPPSVKLRHSRAHQNVFVYQRPKAAQ